MKGTAVNEWVCGNCKSINRAAAGSCYSCGGSKAKVAAVPGADASTFAAASAGIAATDQMPVAVPATLAGPTAVSAASFDPGVPPKPASTSDVLGGLLAGLLAAVLATAVWYGVVALTSYQLGIVAIAVGFLVGQGVVLGARGHASMALPVISVVLTLLALAISEYLIVAYFVGQEVGVPIDIVQPPDFVVGVITDSLAADPLTLAFWAIALFQAVAIPWRAITRWTPAPELPAAAEVPSA
jgi:hypothetical protein